MQWSRTHGLLALAAIALLVAIQSIGPASAQVNPPVAASRWEYRSWHSPPSEREFNTLGSQGWELCVALGPYPNNNVPVTFIFKRQVR